jgi:putative heme-binding domain-containing protein
MSEEINPSKRTAAGAFIRSIVFVLIVLTVYIYIAEVITDISGQAHRGSVAEGVGTEQGREIFFGKGKCSTCHSLGTEGSAIRCPNLGIVEGGKPPFDMPISQRAVLRAAERSKATGRTYTAVEYILESHFDPGAYVVEGFKNEMPTIWKPPIGLNTDEEISVDLFLMSLGGEADPAAITNSPIFAKLKTEVKKLEGDGGGKAVAFAPYISGDPVKGEQIFFDPNSPTPCAKCHTAKDAAGVVRGGKVGPELTSVGGTRTPQYIIESVMDPSAVIVSGFEGATVETKDGDYITGMKKAEDPTSVDMMIDTGEILKIQKSNIETITPEKISTMPGNFRELLTMEQFHDLFAYLMTLS